MDGLLLIAIVTTMTLRRSPIISATRAAGSPLPTVGGFLGEPNATFLLAADDEDVAGVLATIESACTTRDIEVPLVLMNRLRDWDAQTVAHGGATVLIADLDRIVHL
jgi:uncharacterized protein YaaQ